MKRIFLGLLGVGVVMLVLFAFNQAGLINITGAAIAEPQGEDIEVDLESDLEDLGAAPADLIPEQVTTATADEVEVEEKKGGYTQRVAASSEPEESGGVSHLVLTWLVDTAAQFNAGPYAEHWNTLTVGDMVNTNATSGNYFNMLDTHSGLTAFSTLTVLTDGPYEALPDNAAADAGADMHGNVLLLHLDDTAMLDSSGNNNNATHNGAENNTNGIFNQSIVLDGGEQITIPHSDSLNFTGKSFTAEAWINVHNGSDLFEHEVTLSPATPEDNYTVRIDLNISTFDYSLARDDGMDVWFADSFGTPLFHHIDYWDPSGESTLWVMVPSAGTSSISMFHGSGDITPYHDSSEAFLLWEDFESYTAQADGEMPSSWEIYDSKIFNGTNNNTLQLSTKDGNRVGYKMWPSYKRGGAMIPIGENLSGFEVSLHTYRLNLSTGYSSDYFIGTEEGLGYGVRLKHNRTNETRSIGNIFVGQTDTDRTIIAPGGGVRAVDPAMWYKVLFTMDQGQLYYHIYDTDGNQLARIAGNDSNYSSFTHFFIRGPRDYMTDNISVRKFSLDDPVATLGPLMTEGIRKGSEFGLVVGDNEVASQIGGVTQWVDGLSSGWHHYVLTYDGSLSADQQKLYVDGVEMDSVNNTVGLMSTSSSVTIGEYGVATGLYDEVALYNRALSADEVAHHYKRGATDFSFYYRSCPDTACTGKDWMLLNNITGGEEKITVADSQYFQVNASFWSMDEVTSPDLYNFSLVYFH